MNKKENNTIIRGSISNAYIDINAFDKVKDLVNICICLEKRIRALEEKIK